jgi:protein phosphatase
VSDVGRKREHNEDSYLVDEDLGLYIVADGMGGHQGGDHASRMCVEVLRDSLAGLGPLGGAARKIVQDEPELFTIPTQQGPVPSSAGSGEPGQREARDTDRGAIVADPAAIGELTPLIAAATCLRSAARSAGRAIYDAAQEDSRLAGMGTTLTSLLVHAGRAHLAHVGDSRAFLFRDGQISQITQDHSWIAEQVRAGVLSEAEAKESRFRHIITRSVGFERDVEVDSIAVTVIPGDVIVMCSDGLSNYIETEELGRVLAGTYYRRVPDVLVGIANDRGGDDNITVVLVSLANEA